MASIASVLTSYFFLGDDLLFNLDSSESFKLSDTFFYIALGLGTAIASVYFTKMYFAIIKFFGYIKHPAAKLGIGGLAIGGLLYMFPALYGEGFGFIANLLQGDHMAALGTTPLDALTDNIWVVIGLLLGITVFKAVAMTTTFAAGGVGGIIIPTLVMGSALGNVIGKVINNMGLGFAVSEANFTLVGMAGLVAGVLHSPLTAIFLIAEISGGYTLFVPLMITVTISFLVTKNTLNHTIYTKELLARGELLTHDQDQNVLNLLTLDKVIETDFIALRPEMSLGEMLNEGVAKSKRNLFPVVNAKRELLGLVTIDHIREIMFHPELYDSTTVEDHMISSVEWIHYERDDMHAVMRKFNDSSTWNLPVVKNGLYYGFISKSKLLTVYRNELLDITK